MKKIIVLMVSVIALVSCDNSSKIEKDINAALELSEKYVNQCANHYYDESYRLVKSSKTIDDSTLNEMKKNIENDAKDIMNKVFEPLFEKYGEEKTIKKLNEIANKDYYKSCDLGEDAESFTYCTTKYMQAYILKKVAEGMEMGYTENLCKF